MDAPMQVLESRARLASQLLACRFRMIKQRQRLETDRRTKGTCLSWCGTTGPPMEGCLNMYIDCTGNGFLKPSARYSFCMESDLDMSLNTVSRSCSACPILLMLSFFGLTRVPLSSNAPSSKKHEMLLALLRKYSAVSFSCTFAGCYARKGCANEDVRCKVAEIKSKTQ